MAKISGPRIFFDIVGTFQANRLLKDSQAAMTAMNALALDGLTGIMDSGQAIAEQMKAVVDATVPLSAEIERAQIEFQKFLGIGEEFHSGITRQVEEVGMQFGFTATQSLNAGARMAQLSKIIGSETIPAATEMAFAFGLIGDMTPEDAMTKLINLQAQTNFMFEETSRNTYNAMTAEQRRLHVTKEMSSVLNQLNSIEDKSAATMSKITRVMNEFASQADITGESIAMMAAMSATLIEAGEEQGKAGRGLRMIYARLGADTSGAATALKDLGIATTNSDGSLRALSDIILDLKPQYDRMNAGQKQAIAQTVAGNRHYVRFIKLMENSDRVIELNNEALMESGAVMSSTGDAIGYLDTLVESNTVALDRQRASLERVAGMWGDVFIPGQIAGMQVQEEYFKLLLNIITANEKLGSVLAGFVRFQTIMESTFAPMLTALINVKALGIAMNTQRTLMRALAGEQLAYDNQRVSGGRQNRQTLIDEQLRISQKIQQIRDLQDREREQKTQSLNLTRQQIGEIQQEINKREQLKQEIIEGGVIKTNISTNDKAIYAVTQSNKEREIIMQNRHNLAIQQAFGAREGEIRATRTYTVLLQTENGNRKEAILNLDNQKLSLEEMIISLKKYSAEQQKGVYTTEEYEQKLRELGIQLNRVENEQKGLNHTLTGTNMTLMKLSMVAMGAQMSLSLLGPVLMKDATAAERARVEMAAMIVTTALMTAEMILSIKAMTIKTGANVKEGASAGLAAAANGVLASSFQAVGVSAAFATRMAGFFLAVVGSLAAIAAIGIAIFLMDKLLKKYTDVGDAAAIASTGVEDLNTNLADSVGQLDYDIPINMDFSNATDSLREFAGAREELFFGFKAGNVTGDLVKQVQQGGIENFVANTEIIMTNNFNGMTTEEAATQILDEIERGGRARGMTVA